MMTVVDALLTFVGIVCTILKWILIIRIVLSWLGVNPWNQGNQLVSVVYQTSDVLLGPFSKLPLRIGPLDLTPILVIIVLNFIPRLLASIFATVIH